MKNRNLVTVVTIATALILATTAAISLTPDNVFAYKKSQAASLANACGNGEIPTNVGCQNTDSQIQGDENSVALAAQQTFPEVVLEEPTPEPLTCEECFTEFLSEAEIGMMTDIFPGPPESICSVLEGQPTEAEAVLQAVSLQLNAIGVAEATIQEVIECLEIFLGLA